MSCVTDDGGGGGNRVDPVQLRRPTLFRSPRWSPGRRIRSPPSTVVFRATSTDTNTASGVVVTIIMHACARPTFVPTTRGTGGTRPTRWNTVRYVTSLYLFIVHYNNTPLLMAAYCIGGGVFA